MQCFQASTRVYYPHHEYISGTCCRCGEADPDGGPIDFEGAEVVASTPNGRDVLALADGRVAVQPKGDNYWLAVPSVESALDAYEHPSRYL